MGWHVVYFYTRRRLFFLSVPSACTIGAETVKMLSSESSWSLACVLKEKSTGSLSNTCANASRQGSGAQTTPVSCWIGSAYHTHVISLCCCCWEIGGKLESGKVRKNQYSNPIIIPGVCVCLFPQKKVVYFLHPTSMVIITSKHSLVSGKQNNCNPI